MNNQNKNTIWIMLGCLLLFLINIKFTIAVIALGMVYLVLKSRQGNSYTDNNINTNQNQRQDNTQYTMHNPNTYQNTRHSSREHFQNIQNKMRPELDKIKETGKEVAQDMLNTFQPENLKQGFYSFSNNSFTPTNRVPVKYEMKEADITCISGNEVLIEVIEDGLIRAYTKGTPLNKKETKMTINGTPITITGNSGLYIDTRQGVTEVILDNYKASWEIPSKLDFKQSNNINNKPIENK